MIPVIFPWVLSRVGGDSYELIDELNVETAPLMDFLARYDALKVQKEKLKADISIGLFNRIAEGIDAVAGDKLKGLRRNLYNERPISAGDKNFLIDVVSKETAEKITEYIDVKDSLRSFDDQIEKAYHQTSVNIRQKLQNIVAHNQGLRNGLLFSSSQFYNRLNTYAGTPAGRFGKNELQIELGVLKYLTRMCCKTSPFSSFTNLALSKVVSNGNQPIQSEGSISSSEMAVESHIRLNIGLLKFLKSILVKYREFYNLLELTLNPTVTSDDSNFNYLTNHNNVEAFQTMNKAEILTYLQAYFNERKRAPRFNQVLKLIVQLTGSDPLEAESFLKRLIDLGFLEFDFGVSGTDPDWNLKLIRKLAYFNRKGITGVKELILHLTLLKKLSTQFKVEQTEKRKEILQIAFNEFRSCTKYLHELANLPESERSSFEEIKPLAIVQVPSERVTNADEKSEEREFVRKDWTRFYFKPEHIFYEDTTRSCSFVFSNESMIDSIKEVNDNILKLGAFSGFKYENNRMLEYFRSNYSAEKGIPFLNFYEDYYRNVKAKDQVKEQDTTVDVDDQKKIPEKQENEIWTEKFQSGLSRLNINSSKVDLPSSLIAPLTESGIKASMDSYAVFIQPWIDDKEKDMKFVINHVSPGCGKMFSRFIHLFPSNFFADLKKWNAELSNSEVMMMEVTDASYFNANLHPTIMEYEVKIPGGNNNVSPDKTIPISSIEIFIDAALSKLELRHKNSSKKIGVYDMTFQGQNSRSQLFQLLDRFSEVNYINFIPLANAVNGFIFNLQKESGKIVGSPRITIANKFVIQRQAWFIPVSKFPLKGNDETEAMHFMRINEWRLQQNMPEEVFFVSVDKAFNHAKVKSKNEHKPQYLNFCNPLLVRLFVKTLKKITSMVKLEEMLPASKDMLKINNQRFVTEFVVQWYNYEN